MKKIKVIISTYALELSLPAQEVPRKQSQARAIKITELPKLKKMA